MFIQTNHPLMFIQRNLWFHFRQLRLGIESIKELGVEARSRELKHAIAGFLLPKITRHWNIQWKTFEGKIYRKPMDFPHEKFTQGVFRWNSPIKPIHWNMAFSAMKTYWLVVTGCHLDYFPRNIGLLGFDYHPNWLSYFSEGWPNHQPAYITEEHWLATWEIPWRKFDTNSGLIRELASDSVRCEGWVHEKWLNEPQLPRLSLQSFIPCMYIIFWYMYIYIFIHIIPPNKKQYVQWCCRSVFV